MSKMGSHDPFGHLKHKLWPKERSKIKLSIWQFDSRPLKVKNHPNFLACRWHATYCWKALKGYNFASDLTSIGGLHTKLWASKVKGVLISKISRLQLGSPRTKWHLGAGSMARHKQHYKGEGGGFPQVRAVMSFVNPCLLVACPCTKSVPTTH
jgi:hypothetical protein